MSPPFTAAGCVVMLAALMGLGGTGCSDSLFGSKDGADDGGIPVDADPNAPDADPNAPDADPEAPDANPNLPDAGPLSCSDIIPTLANGATFDDLSQGGLNDYHGSCANGLDNEDGVERIYKVVLDQTSDIRVEATGLTGSPDLVVYILDDCLQGNEELLCVDDPQKVELRDAPPGTYYVVVEGYSADDLGDFRLDALVVEQLGARDACDPEDNSRRCETGLLCQNDTCQQATELLSIDFTLNLSPAQITDADNDGNTWKFCSEGTGGCFANESLSPSGGGYAIIDDGAFDPSDGEILGTPTVDASGMSKVLLSFYQYNYNWFACNDASFIEVSTNGSNYTRIETQLDVRVGYQEHDISSLVAGQSFDVRWVYDDATDEPNCAAQYWHLDDIVIQGL